MARSGLMSIFIIAMTLILLISSTSNAKTVSADYPHIYYAYIEYDRDWASDPYIGDVNYLVNTVMYHYIDGKNYYYDHHYPYSVITVQPTVPDYFRNRIEYYSKMHIFIIQSYLHERIVYLGTLTIRLVGYWFRLPNGATVSPYYLSNLDLNDQLYDHTPLRYIVIASPFGYLMNPSAWAYYLVYLEGQYYPTYDDEFPNDMASLFVTKNVEHVVAFDIANHYDSDRLVWVTFFYYGMGGGVYLDFAEKFYRILADQGQQVHLGYYPTLNEAWSIIRNPGNGADSLEYPGVVDLSGPLFFGSSNVPVFT